MSLVGLSEVEQLRDANLRMAAGIEEMAARIEQLEAMIRCLIDNHDHGSYESEGQAFDEARAALTVNIFWSSEDEGFIAVDMTRPGCNAFGETKAECVRELADAQAAWDEAAKLIRDLGEEGPSR